MTEIDHGGVRVYLLNGHMIDLKLGDPWEQTCRVYIE